MTRDSITHRRSDLEWIGQIAPGDGGRATDLLWIHEAGVPREYVAPPDGRTDIVLSSRGGTLALHVVGPSPTTARKETRGLELAISARLRFGAVPVLLGVPAGAIVSQAVSLEHFVPETPAFLEEIASVTGSVARAKLLGAFLDARLRRRLGTRSPLRDPERVVAETARIAAQGEMSTRSLVARVGASERTLRRVFSSAVGVAPSSFVAMLRFGRALVRVASPGLRGGDLAALAGYADQAHMIRDFQARMGISPGRLRRAWAAHAPLLRPSVEGA